MHAESCGVKDIFVFGLGSRVEDRAALGPHWRVLVTYRPGLGIVRWHHVTLCTVPEVKKPETLKSSNTPFAPAPRAPETKTTRTRSGPGLEGFPVCPRSPCPVP